MNFKDFISFFFFIVGLSLSGMESDKTVHVITYKNGKPEEPIAINQETVNILKQSQTITDYLDDLKNNNNFGSKNIEIHLPSLSHEDYQLVVPWLKYYAHAHPWIYHTLQENIKLPQNLSDLIRLFFIADYLNVPSLQNYTKLGLEHFDIKKLVINNCPSCLNIPFSLLNIMKKDINTNFDNFIDQIQPTIAAHSSIILNHTPTLYEHPTTFLSKLKRGIKLFLNDSGSIYTYAIHKNNDDSFNAEFSPDNKLMALFDGTGIKIWNTASGQLLHRLKHEEVVDTFEFSSQGNYLISLSFDSNYNNKKVTLWCTQSGKFIKSIPLPENHTLSDIKISPDEKLTVINNVVNNILQIYDTQTGKLIHSLKLDGSYEGRNFDYSRGFDFSPNSQMLACGSIGGTRVWDTNTWQCIHKTSDQYFSKFSPNNTILITTKPSKATIYDIKIHKDIDIIDISDRNNDVIFSRDGASLVSFYDKVIKIWDFQKQQSIKTITDTRKILGIKYNSTGSHLVYETWGGPVKILNLQDEKCVHTFEKCIYSDKARFSSDGRFLVLVNEPSMVSKSTPHLINLEKNITYSLPKLDNSRYSSFRFNKNNSLLTGITGSIKQVWNTENGKSIFISEKYPKSIISDEYLAFKYPNKITLMNLQKYKNIVDDFESFSPEKKLLLCWIAQAKKQNVNGKTIEQILNNYLGNTSEDVKVILNKMFDISIKPYEPYRALTDLANTAKKAYLLSRLNKK